MNSVYKLVWNAVSNSWVVAGELAKNGKKSSGKTLKLAVLLASGLTAGVANAAPAANELPTGATIITNGTDILDYSVPNQLTITQSELAAQIFWNTFNVGKNAKVIFNQPSSNSFSYNVVNSGSPSEIFGQVTANGHFILTNPSGVVFGAGSQVNAAAIVASTNPVGLVVFDVNNYSLEAGTASGKVENHGTLTATSGSVTLLGGQVINTGTITATGGNVNLLNAGQTMFVNSEPTSIGASTVQGIIQNTGSITATQVSAVGGKILLKGDTSQSTSKIQLAGTLEADSTSVNGGSILINGDINLNGATNTLDLTSTNGYSLTNGAAVNLNGASSGFSVNGEAYTVIHNVDQLQAIGSNLTGKYVIANNIDASATASWNSGAGFLPIGGNDNNSIYFSGIFDGLGHAVDGLTINRPDSMYVGLFGYTKDVSLKNIGLTNVSITGSAYVGSLVGYNDTNTATQIVNNYATGAVSGGSWSIGGLLARSDTYSGNTLIDNNYTDVTVNSGYGWAGGIIAEHVVYGGTSVLDHSYALGDVTAAYNTVGGLAGLNLGSGGTALIRNSYSSGAVLSINNGSYTGGLVGNNYSASIENSYWNTETAGQALGVGNSAGTETNVVGLTTAQSTQLSSYANWGSDIDAQGGTGSIWRIYDGQTGPLLRSFLKPVTVIVNSNSKTYDATNYVINGSYSLSDTGASLLGSIAYGGSANGARNAGTYSINGNGLYSDQQGYDISYVDGTLTINKRVLTITASAASKEYDGKLTSADKPVVVGRQRGDAIVGLTQSYLDKNAGTGKTIVVDGGYTIRDGNNGDNYTVVLVNNYSGVITPKQLIISTVANTKVYDGGVTSANKPVVTGLLTGDRVTGLFQQYETKTVGEDKKLIVKAGYVVNDGNNGGNYTVTEQTSNNGTITTH